MKRAVSRAALAGVIAAMLCPGVRANAACTNLASATDLQCKADAKCQTTILKSAGAYVAAIQKTMQTMTNNSRAGKNTTAQVLVCRGGANNGTKCVGNNGGCTAPASAVGTACNSNADCGGGTGICNTGKNFGCQSVTDVVLTAGQLDVGECQPNQEKSVFSKDAVGAKKKLVAAIAKACIPPLPGLTVDPAEVGLDRIPGCLAGQCSGGSKAGDPCNTANPGGQCTGGSCDFSNGDATFVTTYRKIAECVTKSSDGDQPGARVVDTVLRPLAKVMGTGKVAPQAKPAAEGGPADPLPRQILQMAGSNILQIGGGVPGNSGNSPGEGGGVAQLSLAQCVGGNTKPACLNNADCAGGVCTRNTAGAGSNTLNGAARVHKCCSTAAAANIGLSCISDADCGGTGGACGFSPNCLSNILTVTETKSNGLTTCLVTHTKNSGNTTAATGSVNLTTGAYTTTSPIVTDVFLTSCPKCITNLCDGIGPGTCSSADGSTDQACLPPGLPLAKIPNPFTLTTATVSALATSATGGSCGFCDLGGADGVCNNPPCDSCGTAPGLGGGGCSGGRTCDTTIAVTPKAFCGHCDSSGSGQNGTCDHGGAGDAVCAVGCSDIAGASAECAGKTGIAGSVCDFASVSPGFHGDCSINALSSTGEASQYAPITIGLLCTGKTGVTSPQNVDSLVGLPGLVRLNQPYTLAYVFSKDL